MPLSWSPARPFGCSDLQENAASRYSERSPDALVRGEKVRCCVRGCDRWLTRRRRGGPVEFCPEHKISVSTSPTYVYEDHHENLIVATDLVDRLTKVESWRLGNECSEDALSWNVFISLARLGLLGAAFPELGAGEVELYLWGNRIGDQPVFWDRLARARKSLEPVGAFATEPDVIVRAPGKALILIEAKFWSRNGTLEGKPHTIDDFLGRYRPGEGSADPLNRDWIREQAPGDLLEQLCRNAIFATWLGEGNERLLVVNLVSGEAETDVEERLGRHLALDSPVAFRRMTWESLTSTLASAGVEAQPIIAYMANKTANLRRAFKV